MKICVVGLEMGMTREGVFIGGGANHVIRLCQRLSKTGHEITIVTTPPREHASTGNIQLDWADVYQMPMKGTYPSIRYGLEFTTKLLFRLRKLHKQKKFEVIAGHSGSPLVALAIGIAGKLLGVPAVFTVTYSTADNRPLGDLNKWLWPSRLARLWYFPIKTIISVSENVKTSLIARGVPRRKVEVIPPVVDTETFNPLVSGGSVRKNLGINETDPVILFVADLSRRKGTHVALQAMSEIIKHYPEAKLIMTSELPDRTYDERQREVQATIKSLGLGNNIIRLGIIKNMAETIAASDIFITPFLTTRGILDYPMPVLEAMAIGKPVIASRVGGIPEIISDMETGILIEPGNAVSLSQAILHLCEDEGLRQRLGSNAANFISEKLSPERVVCETEKVYEQAVTSRKKDKKSPAPEVAHFYGRDASLYDERRFSSSVGNYSNQVEQDIVKGMNDSWQGKQILELGAGTGRFSIALALAGASVVSSDITPEMLGQINSKILGTDLDVKLELLVMDGRSLAIKDATFDGCICINMLNHVKDYERVLQEISRILKPGGFVIANFPIVSSFYLPIALHVNSFKHAVARNVYSRWFTLGQINKSFSAAGLKICRRQGAIIFPRNQAPKPIFSLLKTLDTRARNSVLKYVSGSLFVEALKTK